MNQSKVLALALHLHSPIPFIYCGYLLVPVFKCFNYINVFISYVEINIEIKRPLQTVSCI